MNTSKHLATLRAEHDATKARLDAIDKAISALTPWEPESFFFEAPEPRGSCLSFLSDDGKPEPKAVYHGGFMEGDRVVIVGTEYPENSNMIGAKAVVPGGPIGSARVDPGYVPILVDDADCLHFQRGLRQIKSSMIRKVNA